MINDHRQWLYHKGKGGRIFEEGEEIPEGWYDSPAFDDPRTRPMWDVQKFPETKIVSNGPPPVGATDKNPAGTSYIGGYDKSPGRIYTKTKYPSQMNKTELLEFGKHLGITLDEAMAVRELRQAINDAVKNHEGD